MDWMSFSFIIFSYIIFQYISIPQSYKEEEGDRTERKFITETKCDDIKTAKLRYTCHVMNAGGDVIVLCLLSSHWSLRLEQHVKVLVVKVSVADGLQLSLHSQNLEQLQVQGWFSITFYRAQPESHFLREILIWTVGIDMTWCGVVWSVLVTQARLLLETTKPPPALRKSHSLGEAFVGSFTGPAAAHGAKIFQFCFTTT